jgi:hypothetical protein
LKDVVSKNPRHNINPPNGKILLIAVKILA